MKITIDYEGIKRDNYMRTDGKRAVSVLLEGSIGVGVVLFPPALNAVLRALESLCATKDYIVIPSEDNSGRMVYIIVKIGNNTVTNLELENNDIVKIDKSDDEE